MGTNHQYCLVRGQDCPRPLDGTTSRGMRGDNGHRHGVWTGRPTGSWTLRGTGGADGDCRCSGRRSRPGVLPDFRLDTSETMTLSVTRLPRPTGSRSTDVPFGARSSIERNKGNDARELRSFLRAGLPAVRASIRCVDVGELGPTELRASHSAGFPTPRLPAHMV